MVVGYALTCRMQLPAVSDTITEARYQARKHGRLVVVAIDIRNALLDFQIPSDEALREAFEKPSKSARGRTMTADYASARVLQDRCNVYARPLHRRDSE